MTEPVILEMPDGKRYEGTGHTPMAAGQAASEKAAATGLYGQQDVAQFGLWFFAVEKTEYPRSKDSFVVRYENTHG